VCNRIVPYTLILGHIWIFGIPTLSLIINLIRFAHRMSQFTPFDMSPQNHALYQKTHLQRNLPKLNCASLTSLRVMTLCRRCRADFECGHHVVLELSSGAAFTLLVYMSNRWIDTSICSSPIWQLHHKSTYPSLCANIGPTGYEPGCMVFLVITNCDLWRNTTFGGDASWWAVEYNWWHCHWHPLDDFYRHIDCEVQWVALQAMVRGDGASLGAEAGRWDCQGGGWAALGSGGAGCNRSPEIGTSGCSQRLGKTTWYCAIDHPDQHGAATAGIVHGDHGSVDTLGNAGDGIKGEVEV